MGKGLQIKKVGEWREAHDALDLGPSGRAALALDRATKQEAKFFVGQVKENIRKKGSVGGQQFKKITKGTRYKRVFNRIRSRKPLIATRTMLSEIEVEKTGALTYFAGISARKKTAKRAHAAEHGRPGVTIQASRAMIRFLHLLYSTKGDMADTTRRGPSGPVVKTISFNIPARPFMGPVHKRIYRTNQKIVEERILFRFGILTGNKLTKGRKMQLRTVLKQI